jgi:hypothetical protein
MTIKRVFHLGLFLLLFTTTAIADDTRIDGSLWKVYSDTQKTAFLLGISSWAEYYTLRSSKYGCREVANAQFPDNISMAGLAKEIDIFYARGTIYERVPIALVVVYEFLTLSGETAGAKGFLQGLLDGLKTQ